MFNKIIKYSSIATLLTLFACGDTGSNCTVSDAVDGAVITCDNGAIEYIYDGANGNNGIDGANGIDGVNGTDGTNGTNGVDGVDGTNGTDGTDGTNGTDGTDGTNGTDGTDGTNGTDGASGENGVDGSNGDNGESASLSLLDKLGESATMSCSFSFDIFYTGTSRYYTGTINFDTSLDPNGWFSVQNITLINSTTDNNITGITGVVSGSINVRNAETSIILDGSNSNPGFDINILINMYTLSPVIRRRGSTNLLPTNCIIN